MELSQVVLCRGLYGEAEAYLVKDGDMYVGMAVSIAQDAVELFLRAVMKDRPVAGRKIPDDFVQCMDYIDSAVPQGTDQHVPFRAKLIELNKARVSFKHYGLIPNRTDARRLLAYVADFFEEASMRFFNTRFSDISASDLVTSEDVRKRLKNAELALRDEQLEHCLGYCAEAVDVAILALTARLSKSSRLRGPSFGMYGGTGVDASVRRIVERLEEYVGRVAAASEHMAVMLALAVNVDDLGRFEDVTPILHRIAGAGYQWEQRQGASIETVSDAVFAIAFATRFALSAQGRLTNTHAD